MNRGEGTGEAGFRNVYDDRARADAYARLAFPNTYYLAYRDLPDIVRGCARGRKTLDFGCGAGRSTRFLRGLGFDVTGVDIAADMLDVDDRRPVEDVLCTDACYRGIYVRAGLAVLDVFRPLGRPDEPFAWVSETRVAPWVIYVLGAAAATG